MQNYDFKKQPVLLIQGAMDTETEYLIGQLDEPEEITCGNWKFYTGFLGKHAEPVVISRTYQGMVNAAAATAIAMTQFCLWAVINLGIGGGHDARFHRGDIVVGERVVPMGAMIRKYAPEGAGIDEGDFEPLPIEIFDKTLGQTRKVLDFPCDERLGDAAMKVQTDVYVGRGVIGSADEWNNQLDRIALLRERYKTAVEDMESAAPAELCLAHGIPFLGIRIISNSIVTGESFEEAVGVDVQKFAVSFVEQLHGMREEQE